MLEPTLVVVRPAVRLARDSSLASSQQETSFVNGRSPVDKVPVRNPRKRAREESVEL
jgi:hypothetical protein